MVSVYLRMVYKHLTPPILINNYTVEIKDNQRVHKGVHNHLNTMLSSTDLRNSIDIAKNCKTYILTSYRCALSSSIKGNHVPNNKLSP